MVVLILRTDAGAMKPIMLKNHKLLAASFATVVWGCGSGETEAPGAGESNVVAQDLANAARVEPDRLTFPAHLVSASLRKKIAAYDKARDYGDSHESVGVEQVLFVGDRQRHAADETGRLLAGAANPLGYVRRALWYTLDGTDIVIETEDVTIAEAVRELEANGSVAITSDYPYPPHTDTIFIDKSGFELYRSGSEYIRFPSLWVNVAPDTDFDLKVGFFKVKRAKASLYADVEAQLVVDANVTKLPEGVLRKTLYDERYQLAPLGIVPVSLRVRLELGCTLAGGGVRIEGGVHATSALRGDLAYRSGDGVSVGGEGAVTPELVGELFRPLGGGASTLACVIEPDLELLFYDRSIARIEGTLDASLAVTTPPDALDARARLRARLHGWLSRLAPGLGEQDKDLVDVEKILHDGPVPAP
jgi:hypothetical protein